MTENPESQNDPALNLAIINILRQVFLTGDVPDNIPEPICSNPDFLELLEYLNSTQQFTLELANGNLEAALKSKGRSAGALKALQANLRHLTWQTQRIAAGDLTHRVAFMGEFASAFNTMVERLAENRYLLEQHAAELAQQHQTAIDLMHEAQEARDELEQVNRKLAVQLDEIQTLQAQLREQVIRDPLTNCYNRRFLIENMEREFSRAQRENYPISLIMFDIDHFKSVNDTFGHKTGDEVLHGIGELSLHLNRHSDIVTRYGGEEFLVTLFNMPLQDAVHRAEALRKRVLEKQYRVGENTIQVTISLGVAGFPQHGESYGEVIEAADKAMYLAKNSGRNRTVCLGS